MNKGTSKKKNRGTSIISKTRCSRASTLGEFQWIDNTDLLIDFFFRQDWSPLLKASFTVVIIYVTVWNFHGPTQWYLHKLNFSAQGLFKSYSEQYFLFKLSLYHVITSLLFNWAGYKEERVNTHRWEKFAFGANAFSVRVSRPFWFCVMQIEQKCFESFDLQLAWIFSILTNLIRSLFITLSLEWFSIF